MNADQLLQGLTQALFVGVFLVAAARAVRRRLRANVDTALLFGAAAASISLTWVQQALGIASNQLLTATGSALAMALPYLLLRLLDDFVGVPPALLRLAEIGLACSVVALYLVEPPQPGWLTTLIVVYFFVLEVYAAVRFVNGARHSRGVTRRRLQAVAAGSGFLGLTVLVAGVYVLVPVLAGVSIGLSLVSALASGIGYAVGFAPPSLLRRAWQAREVRAFFASAAVLPQQRGTGAIVRTLEASVAAALGAPQTAIGFWDDAQQRLQFYSSGSSSLVVRGQPASMPIVHQVFATQRPIFTVNAARDDPAHAAAYLAAGATAVMAVPISVGETRLGVLAAYGPRASVFAEDDLDLAEILANQVALALGYARELIERERVEAEVLERRRTEAALRESDARKSAILETALDPIITIDQSARIIEFNPAAEQVFGYRRGDVLGADFAETTFPPDLREQYSQDLARFMASGQDRLVDERVELTGLRADQTQFPLEFAVARVATDGLHLFTAFIRDITEPKRSEALIRALNADLERRVVERTAELESAIKELEAFSYSVSHDLRAPLRAVNGFARILLDEHGPELSPDAQGFLRTVCDNAQHMGRLIDDLLAFSRLGRQSLRTQHVLPAEVVRGALDELAPELEDRQVELTIGELQTCQADPVLLRQVYVNLLSNALKFTRRRTVAEIEIGSRQTDNEIIYFVKDNGAGFDMRYVDKLFGVFQRLHRAEDYSGTGVGLAIVQRIVQRHGGRVWAEAAPDQGAAFYFTLTNSVAVSGDPSESRPEIASAPGGGNSEHDAKAA